MIKIPKVSVCVITYSHEPYIQQAIEGVLMQECNYDIEVIIANDASSDKTDEIIQSIIVNHRRGSWIKYLKRENNLGMIPNFVNALHNCGGEYVALCEGDDFWNDPLKLQKQISFLDNNPEYVVSCHDAFVVDKNGTRIKGSVFSNYHKIDYTKEQLIKSPFLMPLTMCFRNVITEFPKEFLKVINGDVFLISMLGQYGKSKFQTDIIPSSYRIHHGGVSSMVSELEKEYQRKNTFYQLFCYYRRIRTTTDTAYNFFIKYKNTILRLLDKKLKERGIFASFKLYVDFLIKCIRYRLWKESAYITVDYFKLLKKQF